MGGTILSAVERVGHVGVLFNDGDIVLITSGMSKALTTLASDGRDAQHVPAAK